MIAITFSTDWAPLPVIRYTLDILRKYDVPATIFCTNDLDQEIMEAETKGLDVELGIHPNFDTSPLHTGTKIHELKKKFPDAMGSRSHRYYSSSTVFRELKHHGFKYDSSVPILHQTFDPYHQYNGIIELPVGWADDISLRLPTPLSIVKARSLVIDLHPVHLFINSHSYDHYLNAKKDYQNPELLEKHRSNENGIKNIFDCLLDKRTDFCLMRDLID